MKNRVKVPDFNFKELRRFYFGSLEAEKDSILQSAFTTTASIDKLFVRNRNYIVSPKGAGKSAVFKAFQNKQFKHLDYNHFNFIFIDEAFGTFDKYLDPDKFKYSTNKRNYAFAWGVYISSKLIKDICSNYSESVYYNDFKIKIGEYEEFKEDFDLYNLLEKIEQLNLQLLFSINGLNLSFSPKIASKKPKKQIDLNKIFDIINVFYKKNNIETKVLIDRVDAFVSHDSYDIQKKYIQGLISATEEIQRLSNTDIMLFIRSDLFDFLEFKFEYDKAKDRTVYLKWTETELLTFIVLRLLSNKYIRDNYYHVLGALIVERRKTTIKGAWLLLVYKIFKKVSPKLIDVNMDKKIYKDFIRVFFPNEVEHYDKNRNIKQINIFDWIFSHFIDKNDFINPRVIIWFLNQLSSKQYNTYIRQPQHPHLKGFCKDTKKNQINLNVFLPSVIHETYVEVSKEEIKGILHRLDTKEEKQAFIAINEKSYLKGYFEFGEIPFTKYGLTRSKYERLLKYLSIVGFCKLEKQNRYCLPLIYQQKIDIHR